MNLALVLAGKTIPNHPDWVILWHRQHPSGLGGFQTVIRFPNSYGASVVNGIYTYSHHSESVEIAVLHFPGAGRNFKLDYQTPITDDVLGHVSVSKFLPTLEAIAALPAKVHQIGGTV